MIMDVNPNLYYLVGYRSTTSYGTQFNYDATRFEFKSSGANTFNFMPIDPMCLPTEK